MATAFKLPEEMERRDSSLKWASKREESVRDDFYPEPRKLPNDPPTPMPTCE